MARNLPSRTDFRISYRVHDWNGAVWITAKDADEALRILRQTTAYTSIRSISTRCGALTTHTNGRRGVGLCQRLTTTGRCPAHEGRS